MLNPQGLIKLGIVPVWVIVSDTRKRDIRTGANDDQKEKEDVWIENSKKTMGTENSCLLDVTYSWGREALYWT